MLTMTVSLLDDSEVTVEVSQPRFNKKENTIHFINPCTGGSNYIHLYKPMHWDKDEMCPATKANRAFVMNGSGETIAIYRYDPSGKQHINYVDVD